MTIRKPFVSVVEFLNTNRNKKVSEILPELTEMLAKKETPDKTHRIVNGKVIEVFCWYHKTWENVETVEYGKKANTKTGLNTFCKQGVNNWTKQQREFRKGKELLLEQVLSGKVKPEDVQAKIDTLEVERQKIVPLTVKVEPVAK